MRSSKVKKLPRRLVTIADFNSIRNNENPTKDTSDTTATMTIIITTISTHAGLKN